MSCRVGSRKLWSQVWDKLGDVSQLSFTRLGRTMRGYFRYQCANVPCQWSAFVIGQLCIKRSWRGLMELPRLLQLNITLLTAR